MVHGPRKKEEPIQTEQVLPCTLHRAPCTVNRQSVFFIALGSAIAVSGLAGSLLVGVNVAKALTFAHGIPLIAVNHIEAHIYANWLTGVEIEFPRRLGTGIGILKFGGELRVAGLGVASSHGLKRGEPAGSQLRNRPKVGFCD